MNILFWNFPTKCMWPRVRVCMCLCESKEDTLWWESTALCRPCLQTSTVSTNFHVYNLEFLNIQVRCASFSESFTSRELTTEVVEDIVNTPDVKLRWSRLKTGCGGMEQRYPTRTTFILLSNNIFIYLFYVDVKVDGPGAPCRDRALCPWQGWEAWQKLCWIRWGWQQAHFPYQHSSPCAHLAGKMLFGSV